MMQLGVRTSVKFSDIIIHILRVDVEKFNKIFEIYTIFREFVFFACGISFGINSR